MCLLASISQGPSYGYALVQKLNDAGLSVANEGSVYLVLKRLSSNNLIDSELVPSNTGPARKVYRTTEAGREVLDTWTTDWNEVRIGVDTMLGNNSS